LHPIRRGAGPIVTVVVCVVIIVAAAGAYILLSSGAAGGTNSASTSTVQDTVSSIYTAPSSTSSTVASGVQTSYTSYTVYTPTTTTSTSAACTTTTTAGSYNPLNLTAMFADYSEVAMHFNGTDNGSPVNETSDYHVLLTTATEFKVNVTLTEGTLTASYVDYLLRNGTALAVTYEGQNETGFEAMGLYLASASTYYIANIFGQEVLGTVQADGLVHSSGPTTQTIGPSRVSVTTYSPNSLPLSVDNCGTTANFTKFTMSVGSVAGEQATLLTDLQVAGSFNAQGSSQTLDVSLTTTSITAA
jgi:flagellin-like protein